jgi:hypothetical protein
MLRVILALAIGLGSLSLAAVAQEKKGEAKKLEGTLVCGKCKFGEGEKCNNVLLVKENGKEVKYHLQDKGAKEKYHGKICKADAEATVEGKVSEKDGKKIIEDAKVTFK